MTPISGFRIFLIGASSGGHKAIMDIFSKMPKVINVAFMAILHSAFNTSNPLTKVKVPI